MWALRVGRVRGGFYGRGRNRPMSGAGDRRGRGGFLGDGGCTLRLGGRALELRSTFVRAVGGRRGRERRGVMLVRREEGVGGGVVGHDSIVEGETGSYKINSCQGR